ncbi:MAG: hypothetical protein GY738_03665, partial [Pseudoalteromonas sp.]|nr:hypothetical protein [Pseudoalteromonas sp.]
NLNSSSANKFSPSLLLGIPILSNSLSSQVVLSSRMADKGGFEGAADRNSPLPTPSEAESILRRDDGLEDVTQDSEEGGGPTEAQLLATPQESAMDVESAASVGDISLDRTQDDFEPDVRLHATTSESGGEQPTEEQRLAAERRQQLAEEAHQQTLENLAKEPADRDSTVSFQASLEKQPLPSAMGTSSFGQWQAAVTYSPDDSIPVLNQPALFEKFAEYQSPLAEQTR